MWTDRAAENLALHVGDDADLVHEHRRRVADALGLPSPDEWCWLEQVHGVRVVAGEDGATASSPPVADAAVTAVPGLPLVVMTADCVPLALASDDAVAVVHAGWAGLVAGVVEAAVGRLRAGGSSPIRAAIGPCARPDRYAFGRAELDRIAAELGPEVVGVTIDGRPALDLAAGVRSLLRRVEVDDVWDSQICTIASPDHFSYRGEGQTGRQAMIAWIPRP